MFSSWYFIIFSVSFSHSSIHLLWLLNIFMALLWTLYQVGCFSVSSRPFFWDLSYSFVSSFCLTLWVCLYILDKTSAFCSLEVVVLKGRSVEDEPWGLEWCPSHPLEPGAQRSSLVWTTGPRWWWWNLSSCTGSWVVMWSPCADVAWLCHRQVKHTGHTPGLHVVQLLMQGALDAGSLPSCSWASVGEGRAQCTCQNFGCGRAAVWGGWDLGYIYHASRLEGGTENGSHQLCDQQVRMKMQKWCPAAFSSLEKVISVCSFSSVSHVRISNWISLTYCLGVFQAPAFWWISRQVSLWLSPLKSGFSAAVWGGWCAENAHWCYQDKGKAPKIMPTNLSVPGESPCIFLLLQGGGRIFVSFHSHFMDWQR